MPGRLGEEVHGGVDPHLGPRADDGAVEHSRACSKERAVAYGTAGKVRAGANEHVVTDGRRMPFGAADDGILHDDTLTADGNRAALSRQHRAKPDGGARTYRHVAADHAVGAIRAVGSMTGRLPKCSISMSKRPPILR